MKMNIEPIGLPADYYKYLLTGGTGQASKDTGMPPHLLQRP